MNLEVLDARVCRDVGRWQAVLDELPHDYYHLPDYCLLEADRLGGRPIGVFAESLDARLFWPLIVRPVIVRGEIVPGVWDGVSPYGYGSPLVWGNAEACRRLVREAVAALGEEGVCCAFVRFHPLLAAAVEVFGQEHRTRMLGYTVVIPVAAGEQATWSGMRSSTRWRINRAARLGYYVVEDVRWERLDEFIEIYYETMERVGARRDYYFSREYFERLREIEGAHLFLVRRGDEVAGGSIILERCGIAQYHLSGTSARHLRQAPMSLLLGEVRKWAITRGLESFHLGGGVGGREDKLFEFKAGFSKEVRPFFVGEVIVNRALFEECVARWQEANGRPAGSDFFPPYRIGA